MSLHAVVYKRLESISAEIRELVRVVNPLDGEIGFISDQLEAHYGRERLLAADVALGNLSMVQWLSNEIEKTCRGKCPRLLKLFLYSGSHSGDHVEAEEVAPLERELQSAGLDAPSNHKDIREFARKVEILIAAAKAEGNPIVFV